MKLDHFPDSPYISIQHQYWAISLYSEISQEAAYHAQAFPASPESPLFSLLPFPHLLKQPSHRTTDSQIRELFYASSQVTRLKLSTPPYPRENNNKKLKTMSPLSVFGGRTWIANHKGGTGHFWRGNGAILGSTWHEIE